MRLRWRSYSSDTDSSGYTTALRTIVEEKETDVETAFTSKSPSELMPHRSKASGLSKPEMHRISCENHKKATDKSSSGKHGRRKMISHQYRPEKSSAYISSLNSVQSSQVLNHGPRDDDTLSSRDLASTLFPEFFAVRLENEGQERRDTCTAGLKTVQDPLVESWLGFYGRNN
jgi:hypothetical protein